MFSNLKKIILLSFVLFTTQYKCQTYTLSDLDSITDIYRNKGELEHAVQFNLKALGQYEKANNKEGLVAAKINIGNLLCSLDKNKESIEYLDRAKRDIQKIENPVLYTRLYNEYGRNYALLGLYEQSNLNLNKAENYSKKIKNQEQKKRTLTFNYSWKRFNFESLEDEDSLVRIQKKALNLYPDEPLSYLGITSPWIRNGEKLDSAEYYLNKALPLSLKKSIDLQANVLTSFGDLYMMKGENEKALEYYFKSLDPLIKMKKKFETEQLYTRIADVYKKLNNNEKASLFYDKASTLNDSINDDRKKAINIVVDKFLQEKEEEKKQETTKFYIIISIIILATLALIFFTRRAYLKKQKKKDELIHKKAIETKKLKLQVNESFDEVVQLAKTSDPFFLTRFKEVYHEFYETLTSSHPDLSDHDVKFCAYIRLNLTTKEISQYENISVRTVESKRYRLKKKLDLASEIDLNKWIVEL